MIVGGGHTADLPLIETDLLGLDFCRAATDAARYFGFHISSFDWLNNYDNLGQKRC
jgi:hypothetical protein